MELSFAERIKHKVNSGFDNSVKANLAQRKEQREVAVKVDYKVGKKMPKQHYSKLPVSVIKHIKGQAPAVKKLVSMDPRFSEHSGKLNKGMFAKSYSFLKEVQKERYGLLKSELREAEKIGDTDARHRIKDLMGEEKVFSSKQRKLKEEVDTRADLKAVNMERASEGKSLLFAKKSDIKEAKLKKKFDELDQKGQLDKTMNRMAEMRDGKKPRR